MLDATPSSHRQFLQRELAKLLPQASFAARMQERIGDELHYRLVEWPDEEESAFSRLEPVKGLYDLICGGWSLDPEWLAEPDGSYSDSKGHVVPAADGRHFTGAEQLAAYGLWLISDSEFESLGDIAEEDYNYQGWSREDVQQHRAVLVLLAYQALTFAQKLMLGAQLSVEELEKAAIAAANRRAADARHDQPNGSREKRQRIRERWMSGEFRSRDECAEKEGPVLGMSFSTARKALRNTPDPK